MNNPLPIKISLPDDFFNEERRSEYVVPAEMKEVWAVCLDLMVELQRVCTKHGLKVFAEGGTLLGAARHKGFIPWDDDMDFMMLREDYDKLLQVGPAEFKEPYFFQTTDTDPVSLRGHIQIRNSMTTSILSLERNKNLKGMNQGIFIDVFPIDNLPINGEEAYIRELYKTRKKVFWWRNFVYPNLRPLTIKTMIRWAIFPFAWLHNKLTHVLVRKEKRFERLCTKYANDAAATRVCEANFVGENLSVCFPKNLYDNPVVLPFESFSVLAPGRYQEMLTIQYGEWRRFSREGSVHAKYGGPFFDPHTPFTEYTLRKKRK